MKAGQDDLGKILAHCAEVVNRAERLKTYNSRLEASITLKETGLKCQTEIKDLKVFKISALDLIKDLEGKMKALIVEAS